MLETSVRDANFGISVEATVASASAGRFLLFDEEEVELDLLTVGYDFSLSVELVNDLLASNESRMIDLDAVMASVAYARMRSDISAEHLSKIWRIDLTTTKRTLDFTSQLRSYAPNADLSRTMRRTIVCFATTAYSLTSS